MLCSMWRRPGKRRAPSLCSVNSTRSLCNTGCIYPDPASAERAAIGGVIGANATGAHSIRYGMTGRQCYGDQMCVGRWIGRRVWANAL